MDNKELIQAAELLYKHCKENIKRYEKCDCPFSFGSVFCVLYGPADWQPLPKPHKQV